MSLPQEPLGIRRRSSSLLVRYSYRHSHSTTLHDRFSDRFTAEVDAPLPRTHKVYVRDFGSELEPRYIVRAGSLDQ